MDRYVPRNPTRESEYTASKGSSKALSIDYQTIKRTIGRLRKHHDRRVDDSRHQSDINQLNQYVQKLYHTNGYEKFYELIVHHFNDLRIVVPGTIGAYCYGCNRTPRPGAGLTPGCSALCAGGIPPPKLPEWATCEHNVILLHLSRNSSGHEVRTFQPLNRAAASNHCYVFVLRDSSYSDPVAGVKITDDDFKVWHPILVRSYQIFEYGEGECKDLSGVITVPAPPPRPLKVALTEDEVESGTDGVSGIWLAAFILLILLIAIPLGLRHFRVQS